jgi:hypothetical protein
MHPCVSSQARQAMLARLSTHPLWHLAAIFSLSRIGQFAAELLKEK